METKFRIENDQTKLFFKSSDEWRRQSSALRTKYPTLTSEDVKFETGKERELFERIETRLRKNRDQLIGILINIHKDVIKVA